MEAVEGDGQPKRVSVCHIDTPLLTFNDAGDLWSIRDSCAGLLVLGGPGSGKTACVAALVRLKMLLQGFGFMVLTVKKDEARKWIETADRAGRRDDIIHVTRDGTQCFDPLTHEMRRGGPGAGDTNNIVSILSTLANVGKPHVTSGGDESARFFRDSSEQAQRAAVNLLAGAGEPISLMNIRKVINSLPEMAIPEDPENHSQAVKDWMNIAYAGKLLSRIVDRHIAGELSPDRWRAAEYASEFLCSEWPALAPQTRTSIKQTFSSMADKLLTPPFDRLLCSGKCTYAPEQMYMQGKIIILDLPTTEYGVSAELFQIANKLAAQAAIQRRDVRRYPRPCTIFADEFQVFSVPQDAAFSEIAREARGCVVYLTQNLQNVARRLQEHQPGAGTLSLIGNIQTRVFLQNGESEFTNRWAADSFGKEHVQILEGGPGGVVIRHDYRYLVEPATFASLPTPTTNDPYAVGIVYRGGQPWIETGKPYLFYAFPRL